MTLVCLVVGCLGLGGCGDSEPDAPADAEECVENQEITTDSGLVYVDLECGDGDVAEGGTAVSVHYIGRLRDGSDFDSANESEPFRFLLGAGQVVEGWDEGIQGMLAGGTRELKISPELAFGSAGAPPFIPPRTTLIYEVELLEVVGPPG